MTGSGLSAIVAPFAAFVDDLKRGPTVAILCHSDGDGLAAGVILAKALERAGHRVAVEITGKGGGAWSPGAAETVARHEPQALVVADLGCRGEPVLPGVPTLFLDHHRPEGVPEGAVLVTGYGLEPTPTSGLLAFEAGRLIADVGDLDWVAAISLVSDLGSNPPFQGFILEVRKRHAITPIRDGTALLNAARRSPSGDARPAFDALSKAADAKDIVAGRLPETAALRAAKAEVAQAFAAAKKAAPIFAGRVALVRVDSSCQVHPMLVPIWRTRLPKNIVMVANSGYIPGQVNFTVRTATDVNLIDFLREYAPPDPGPNYGHGHDQATGGALPYAVWNQFIAGLGFGAEAHVARPHAAGAAG